MNISTKQAVIKTAAIEIKSLQINAKQVTLAVFRQMDIKRILDYENLKINGFVWGRVNYCAEKHINNHFAPQDNIHIHIIWELEGKLFRDTIFKEAARNIHLPLRREEYKEAERFHNLQYDLFETFDLLFIAV